MIVSTSGVLTYDAWYEWYPDYAYDFDLDISAGDVYPSLLSLRSTLLISPKVVSLYVNATTSTSGSATIENLTTGKTVTKSLTSTSALGGQNAEWIVEDYTLNNALIAFADFENITFTECAASTCESSEGVSSAQIMEIDNNDDEVLTSVTLISDSSFEVSYTSGSSGSSTSSGSSSSSSDTASTGSGKGFGESAASTSDAGVSGKGFMALKRFLWGRPSTSGGL